ncbi:hypothetical protein CF326_g6405 [Tilletia indica]|nr:hypothetical protein CF326_g6405 [Tilletia indica]
MVTRVQECFTLAERRTQARHPPPRQRFQQLPSTPSSHFRAPSSSTRLPAATHSSSQQLTPNSAPSSTSVPSSLQPPSGYQLPAASMMAFSPALSSLPPVLSDLTSGFQPHRPIRSSQSSPSGIVWLFGLRSGHPGPFPYMPALRLRYPSASHGTSSLMQLLSFRVSQQQSVAAAARISIWRSNWSAVANLQCSAPSPRSSSPSLTLPRVDFTVHARSPRSTSSFTHSPRTFPLRANPSHGGNLNLQHRVTPSSTRRRVDTPAFSASDKTLASRSR